MLIYFFISAFLLSTLSLLFNNKIVAKIAILVFILLHSLFTIYTFSKINSIELVYFTYDKLGIIFLVVLNIISWATIYHGFSYLKNSKVKEYNYYHAALILLISAITGVYIANSNMVIWIFVELTTLSVSVLIYHERTKTALEATWKYVFVCSIGIAFAYIGLLFFNYIIDLTSKIYPSIKNINELIALANPIYLKIAFIFILVGYSTKMGLFPMHTVTVDAHTVAPPPISALISTALMNVGFIAIFRIYNMLTPNIYLLTWMNNVLIISGISSLIVATGYILKASHNKRMLAYSSLENMGIVAIALGVGGIGYYIAILHLILHSFIKAGLFYQIGQSYKIFHSYKINESGEYMKYYPLGALVLMIGLICITAIPPSGMFITEFMLFKALFAKKYYFIMILSMFLISYIIYGLFTRFMHIIFSKPIEQNNNTFTPKNLSPYETISQFILFGMVILICFYQPPIFKEFIVSALSGLPK
jgi:hydrogenase-4 component F